MNSSVKVFSRFCLIAVLLILGNVPEAEAVRPVECKSAIAKAIGKLQEMKTDEKTRLEKCENNKGEEIDWDTRWKKYPGIDGDCEQTYTLVNKMVGKSEEELEKACEAFNRGAHCQSGTQKGCQGVAGDSYYKGGTHVRQAVFFIKKADQILREKKITNSEKDIAAYAGRSKFDPALLNGTSIPDLEGDAAKDFFRAKEQLDAISFGKQYLEISKPIEEQLNQHQATLNSMAAEAWKREKNLGESTITGGPKSDSGAASNIAQMAGVAAGSSNASYPAAGFLVTDADVAKMSEDDFYDGLEGRPVKMSFAAPINRPERAEKTAEDSAEKFSRNGDGGEGESAGNESSGKEDAKTAQSANGAEAPAFSNLSAPGGLGGNASTGIAKPDLGRYPASFKGSGLTGASIANGDRGGMPSNGANKGNFGDALQNYTDAQKSLAAPGKAGPSLRDLLRQKMANGSGASTAAMHEVLAELGADSDNPVRSLASPDSPPGAQDGEIKGAESESLFVRIRAAHLRYQRVHRQTEEHAGL